MSYSNGTGAAGEKLTLQDMEATVEKLRGIPPAKWLLVSPDGRMWAEEDVRKLMLVLMGHSPILPFHVTIGERT